MENIINVDGVSAGELALYKAMMEARKEVLSIAKTNVVKTKDNRTKYMYAGLPEVHEEVLPKLFKNDIFLSSSIGFAENGDPYVKVSLIHVGSGAMVSTPVPLFFSKEPPSSFDSLNPMQRMGSAITYASRYGVLLLLSIAPTDDDGQGAGNGNKNAFKIGSVSKPDIAVMPFNNQGKNGIASNARPTMTVAEYEESQASSWNEVEEDHAAVREQTKALVRKLWAEKSEFVSQDEKNKSWAEFFRYGVENDFKNQSTKSLNDGILWLRKQVKFDRDETIQHIHNLWDTKSPSLCADTTPKTLEWTNYIRNLFDENFVSASDEALEKTKNWLIRN